MSEVNFDELLVLRNEYVSCIKLAHETDSKKEDAALKHEAQEAITKLRKMCPHLHTVCLKSEYRGSYSMDHDDRHPESRTCLFCGEHESAYDNKWKALTTKPFARFEGNAPEQIKYPLNYLLSESQQIAEETGYHYHGSHND